MPGSLFSRIDASIICIVLFFLMLLMVGLGNRMRRKLWNAEEGDTKGGVNSLLGALFGLWGFILAFTFGQSGSRFETVRNLIVDESNSLRNAVLRADMYPDSVRNGYRVDLKKYLEERIVYYDYATDNAIFKTNRKNLSKTAASLWARTAQNSKNPTLSGATLGMSGALTSLFDLGIKREALLSFGVPTPISYMLIILALAICVVGGFTTPSIKRKEWTVVAVFAMLACTVLYITIDLARPMEGLIRPDTGQDMIIRLRQLF